MKTVKRLYVPQIENLERMSLEELDLTMETKGFKFSVSENNWPNAFPYTPSCNGSIARSYSHLAIIFHVRGLDLRATALEDNGPTFQDSCCEFFITDPYDGTYYNFEINCIGTVNAAKRTSRINREKIDPAYLTRVIRHTTIQKKSFEKNDSIESWSVAMLIPLEMIGIDPENVPVSARCNIYKCGDKTAHPHYLSWNPIQTPKPDFHRPEYFGELIFK